MADRQEASDQRPVPRLYLTTPAIADAAPWRAPLAAALGAADVAAVLLRLAPGDERSLINCIKALAPVVQEAGAALILDGHPELVARAGADGAHLTGLDALEAAIDRLKPDRIAGVGGLKTRHDAMTAAERGADYVLFGEPDKAGARPPFAALRERIAWWSEIVEVPCVGFAADLDEASTLAEAGADFVALGEFVWNDKADAAALVAQAARHLRLVELV